MASGFVLKPCFKVLTAAHFHLFNELTEVSSFVSSGQALELFAVSFKLEIPLFASLLEFR